MPRFVAQDLAMPLLLREDEPRIDIVRLKDLCMLNRYLLIMLVVNQQDWLVVGTNQERRCYAFPTPCVLILTLESQTHLMNSRFPDAQKARERLGNEDSVGKATDQDKLLHFQSETVDRCDRGTTEELMALGFMKEAANVVFIGPNGVGKSTLAKNVAQQALVHGHKVLFTTAGEILGELAAFDSASTLGRRLIHYVELDLLVIDEVDNLSYSDRHADLLFELVSRRYQKNSTIVTSKRPLSEWHEMFPNTTCAASIVDRLQHLAEVISIEGESYAPEEESS
jgi:DNA replication protein DnaC